MALVTLRTKSSCSYWTIEFSTITLILILSFYHDIYLCKPAHCHFDLTLLLAWLFKTQLCVEDVRRLQGPCRNPLAVAVEGRCVLLSCLSLGHWVLFLLCLERTTWSCRGAMTVFFPLIPCQQYFSIVYFCWGDEWLILELLNIQGVHGLLFLWLWAITGGKWMAPSPLRKHLNPSVDHSALPPGSHCLL